MQQGSRHTAAGTRHTDAGGELLATLNGSDAGKTEALARAVIATTPDHAFAWEALSIALLRQCRFEESIAAGRRAIVLSPDTPDYHANLGVALRAANLGEEAKAAYRAALRCNPAFAAAHHNLGNLLRDENALDEAQACYSAAVHTKPVYPEAWHGLGIVEQSRGRLAEAEAAFAKAREQAPGNAEILNDLATCLMAQERMTEAQELLLQAVALDPKSAKAHGNLGALYLKAARLLEAREATRHAVELAPDEHRWLANLAVIAKDLGRFSEAEDLFRRALALKPGYQLAHANLLFLLNYHPTRSAEDIFAEYRRFDAAHAARHLPPAPVFANVPDPKRPLRIAYLSPDFREHSARHFIEPLLAHHDPAEVEVFCYAEVIKPDAATHRFTQLAPHWRSTVGLSDDEVADLIRRDGIDVAIDLGGHTASSRILALARKPAPIQVTYLLSHGYTSGLSCMDAFLADAALVPEGADTLFAETVVRLPRIPLAYTPPQGMPEPAPLPARTRGHVTFGYFGRPERLNDRVVAAWAQILTRVPGSRLKLNSKAFSEPAFRTLFAERFAPHGIGQDRLDMVYTSPQPRTWAAYGEIDIALDPFPHNAGTTTIEALWLGVPVVSLADRPSVGRFGAMILGSLGLDDWVAPTLEAYVERAVTAASGLDALAVLRASLRTRFLASPLADGKGLARSIEHTLRVLWNNWCKTKRETQSATPSAAQSELLRRQGRLIDAETVAREAAHTLPSDPAAANALGNALAAQGRLLDAEAAFGTAIALDAAYAEAHNNRALSLMRRGQFAPAEKDLRRAISLRPDLTEIRFNLAYALQEQGNLEEALAEYRIAHAERPDHAIGHGMMLFCLSYQPHLDPAEIFAEFRRWDHLHTAPHAPKNRQWSNDRAPDRRLRIGYVSADFCHKSARHFIEPMLTHHNRGSVEVFCYAEVASPDAVTARLKPLADHWRSTVGLSDDEVAAKIRDDRIDILVDLGGHTARNRLRAFARKPAPVQIEHFLGHGYTSGLSAMDAFLADHALAPEGTDQLFAETVVRLPRIPLAYAAPEGMPEVAPLPALSRGYITFGHFGRAVRLNDEVIEAWAKILLTVPQSRLVLNTLSFADTAVCERTRARFARFGISGDRLDLVFTTPQPATWAAYHGIDIALDPFPHNAGTTTIEALWMGVPVVSLAGRPSVGRFGASILGAAGLTDWVAETVDQYVARAVAAARNTKELAALRRNLRRRIESSDLCDGHGLTAALETAYRALWHGYCARQTEIDRLQQEAARCYGAGEAANAADLFRQALALEPCADIRSNLGAALRAAGQLDAAETAYREAIEANPGCAPAHGNLGNLLNRRGHAVEAEAALRRSLELEPGQPELLRTLALSLMAQDKREEAQAILERALAIAPDDVELHNSLGMLLRQSGTPVAALQRLTAAGARIAGNPRALSNMGIVCQDLGRFSEAEDLFRRALALKPGYQLAHANLLFLLNYHPTRSAEDIFAEYRRFDAAHAARHLPPAPVFANVPDPKRPLRIAYLSPDFREHSARHFIEPLLAHHDPAEVEVFCYAEVIKPDAATHRFTQLAPHWRSTVGLSDDEVADLIRRDGIDVAIDLGGHTASSRILALAHKPAPIQVTYLLSHGYTSGLSCMDAFLADAALVPEGADTLFAETVVRLPRIPLAYTPPQGMPEPAPLPARTRGHVTFGYFGRPERLNDRVVAAWAQILTRVPGSRLKLNSKAFSEPAFRTLFAERFAPHGIGQDRLDMVYTSPQPRTWAAYGEIDIALDPFPHNAGTTTIEALWLGVPVVSLADRPSVGRFGAMILGSLGLDDWVAPTLEAYVERAVTAASGLDALAVLRASLRTRFLASPLADGKGLARSIEHTLRVLWNNWCKTKGETAPVDLSTAIAAFKAGNFSAAWSAADAQLCHVPHHAEAHHVRGLAAYRLGRTHEAADDLLRSLAQKPGRADWYWNTAAVLRCTGRLDEAETSGREAVRFAPAAPEAHNNLGLVLKDRGLGGEAEAHFRKAVELKPGYADAWSNLAYLLSVAGQARQAETAARHALALNADDPNALNNLGTALMQQDRLEEASQCFASAVALKPAFHVAHSNLLFCLNYRPDLGPEEIFAAYRQWDEVHAAPLGQAAPQHDNDRLPERRLRVGYVSPDFRHHAVSFFIEPLLAAHDRSAVEITCYAEVANPDAVTHRFMVLADRWRTTVGMSDDAVAELIRADGIDILVDLAGHTAGNRLLAFARKPAPVQVAHMIGSGTTTGLSAFDGFLTDAALAPAGSDLVFSENLVRLPRIPLTYTPPAGMPEVAPLPAATNGYVTFGCFSRAARINDHVVAAWAKILALVPGSRLVLNSKPFQEEATRSAWQSRFATHRIGAHRIDLVYTTPQPATWAAYHGIDIALDPYPHNAGTTTIEALWMGVPVISLADRPPVGRFGASILGSLGLGSWVAADVDRYVGTAAAAAADLPALASIRAGLRTRFRQSPLGDAAGLARAIEAAYRELWYAYCARETSSTRTRGQALLR